MAIADDFSIDYVNKRITYTGGFTGTIADSRYTVNELYSYLQDTFDEPAQMDDPVPMSAQTPTQYTIINLWFMDDDTVKALYSGSIQTNGWSFSAGNQTGITQVWYNAGGTDPDAGDIGLPITDGSATGVLLDYDTARRVLWIRNTNGTQFVAAGSITVTGGTGSVTAATDDGKQQAVRSGESVWANCYSVGTVQADAEIYLAQESEWHGGDPVPVITKLTSWWDTDTDFTASTNGVSAGHIDVLVKVRDAGIWIDDLGAGNAGRIAAYARQGGTVYSHFEFTGAVGNFVIPFASTGYDINVDGFYRMTYSQLHNTFADNEVITGQTSGATGIAKDVSGGNIDYILTGKDLTDFSGTEVIIGTTSTPAPSAVRSGGPTSINGAVANGITITFGHTTSDVDQDGTVENYACTIDCNNQSLDTVYQRTMFLTRRGSTADLLPDPSGGYEDGEFYRGVGDIYATYSTETSALTEGVTVSGVTSAAEGELVAYKSGGNGYVVLTNTKGTFQNAEEIADSTSGRVTLNSAPASIVDVNAAPFGTFAGGRFFVARGVLLTNVPAADNNNWQTSDVAGTAYQPPTTITLTLAGLTYNDRGVVLEVATDGGTDVVKTTVGLQLGNAYRGNVGTSGVHLDATVQQDVPLTGWIRVVDTSEAANGTEYRYEFSSISGSGVTFQTVDAGTGAATATHATNSGVILESTGIGGNDFNWTAGKAKTGHHIRNVTDDSTAVILRSVSDDQIETTPLTGGTDNYWESGDDYEINTVIANIAEDDTCYFPFIDDVCPSGGATSLSRA